MYMLEIRHQSGTWLGEAYRTEAEVLARLDVLFGVAPDWNGIPTVKAAVLTTPGGDKVEYGWNGIRW